MLDLSPFTSAMKPVLPPTPQAAPRVAEEMMPVPDVETGEAVPPPRPPAKGNDPGLGGNVDLYDSHEAIVPPNESDAPDSESVGQAHLLGEASEMPAPAPHAELPFLKPLGRVRGQAIDARI